MRGLGRDAVVRLVGYLLSASLLALVVVGAFTA